MGNQALIVPVEVKAWVVNQSPTKNTIRRWANDYKNLRKFLSPEPKVFDESWAGGAGAYISWELPAGLKHGLRSPSTGAVTFPAVPNRWLLVRLNGTAGTRQATAWALESDFLNSSSGDGATFPADPTSTLGQVLLGRYTPLGQWQETSKQSPGSFLQQPLTAVANGDITFSKYQPYNPNVFSFFDALNGIDASTLSYWVMGWYADLGLDPITLLNQFMNNETQQLQPQKSAADAAAQALNDTIDKMAHDYLWQISDDMKSQFTQLQYTVCHGMSLAVQWNKNGPAPASAQGEIGQKMPIQVAIGNTSMDALSALIKASGANGTAASWIPPTLLDAFNKGLLDKLQEVDGEEELMHQQHQAGFGSVAGGTHWEIVTQQGNSLEETTGPTLSTDISQALDGLNQAQLILDHETRLLKHWQWKLYTLWFASGAYTREGGGDLTALFQQVLNTSTNNSFFAQVKQQQSYVDQLSQSLGHLGDGNNSGTGLVDALSQQLQKLTPSCNLKSKRNDVFWQPVDPVVLITGIQSASLVDVNTALSCRLPVQLLTQVQYKGGQFIKPPPPLKVSFTQLPLPQNIVMALLQEFNLLDAAIVPRAPEVQAAQAQQQLPSFSLAPWVQPWDPLFIEWDLKWYPIPFANWSFNETQYQLTTVPTSSNLTPQTISGRVFLSPQTRFSFKSKIDLLIQQHPELLQDFPELNTPDFKQAVAQWDMLAQRLNGFNAQLVCQDKRINRLPSASSTAEQLYVSVMDTEKYHAPICDGGNPFQPLRQGQFYVDQMSVIDAFGQAVDVIETGGSGSNFSLFISDDLKPDTVVVGVGGSNTIQLSPRLVQPARLRFDWLSAQDDSKTIALNSELNPVCGWVLPNYLDQALQICDPQGVLLGELKPVGNNAPLNWNGANLTDLSKEYPQLVNMLQALQTQEAYQELSDSIDTALTVKNQASTRYLRYFSAYAGRPLALVRAQWQFELNSPCYQDPSWTVPLKNILNQPIAPHGSPIIQAQIGDDPAFQSPLYLRFGNPNLSQDALVGLFLQDYKSFHAVYPAKTGTQYVQPITGQELKTQPLSFQQGSAVVTSLLIDPSFPLHVYSDILPVQVVSLPDRFVHPALQQMEMAFKIGPVLIEKPLTSAPASMSYVQMTKPALGDWLWVETALGSPTITQAFDIRPADVVATFGDQPYRLAEGWLQAPLSDENSSPSANNLRVAQDIVRLMANFAAPQKKKLALATNRSFTPLADEQRRQKEAVASQQIQRLRELRHGLEDLKVQMTSGNTLQRNGSLEGLKAVLQRYSVSRSLMLTGLKP